LKSVLYNLNGIKITITNKNSVESIHIIIMIICRSVVGIILQSSAEPTPHTTGLVL